MNSQLILNASIELQITAVKYISRQSVQDRTGQMPYLQRAINLALTPFQIIYFILHLSIFKVYNHTQHAMISQQIQQ